MNRQLATISAFVLLFILSCKKDTFLTSGDAVIDFSADSVQFDTVFVSTGSVTKAVKIINPNDQKILLKDIRLMGGTHSVFKININGANTTDAGNIEIAANDSIYLFVSVLINPNTSNLAFILQDSILVAYNGNEKFIQLQAYGQNAHFLRNRVIQTDSTWINDLPYVVLGGLEIDSAATLTIQPGCKIYFHADAPLIVNGSLKVQGNNSSKVYFMSDRLDDPYKNFPAAWPGIYFRDNSKDNEFWFAVIKNSYQGVVAENPAVDAHPKLSLNNCIIDNVYDAGIIGSRSSITAQNCLVSNCGKNIVLGYGGDYSFTNCTVVSYSNDYIAHIAPVLSVSNYLLSANGSLTADLHAGFVNCIFWGSPGSLDDEVVVSQQGSNSFTVDFTNCLWRIKNIPVNVSATQMLNTDPLFDSIDNSKRFYDFHLQGNSPAVDAGVLTAFPFDLDGNQRVSGNATDLGCYELQQ